MRTTCRWMFLLPLVLVAAVSWGAEDQPLMATWPTMSATRIVFTHGGYLWSVPRAGGEARQLTTGGHEANAAFSPDGRWIAFVSDLSGRPEVYVRAWSAGAATGSPVPVSIAGGGHPVWIKRGPAIAWADLKGKLQRAEVRTDDGLRVSAPHPWLTPASARADDELRSFDLLPDGRVLFVEKGEDEDDISRFDVVLNWFDELERRAGVARVASLAGATRPQGASKR